MTSDVFKGGVLPFDGNPKDLASGESPLSLKLRELREKHGSTHVFHASENTIACIPLAPDAALIGKEKQFDILTDFQLANALARSALFEFFKAAGNETVVGFRPVTLLLEKHNLASVREDVFGAVPGVHTGCPLRDAGVSLTCLYMVRVHEDDHLISPCQRRYVASVEKIRQGMVVLSDSDVEEFPAGGALPRRQPHEW